MCENSWSFTLKKYLLFFLYIYVKFSSIQSISHFPLFATPWNTAHQAFLSINNSWSLPKLMSIKLMKPSNHLILCHPLLLLPPIFSSIRVLSSESALRIRCHIGASVSASVLPVNIQGWFPLGLTGFISLLSKGLSRVFFSITVWKHQLFSTQLSLWFNSYIHMGVLEKL